MFRVALVLSALIPATLLGNEALLVRERVRAHLAAEGAEATDPRVAGALGELHQSAVAASANGFLLSDGRWADLDYAEIPSGGWSPWDHFRRISTLARAWATPGQPLHHDPVLLAKVETAILFAETFYGPSVKAEGNWWFWTIGPALEFGPSLVLVADAVDPAVLASGTRVLEARIGPYPGISSSWSLLEGQNAVWSAMNHLMLAAVLGDQSRMQMVADRMNATVRVTAGDGLKSDLSFHQHGPQLYTGGYGSSFAYEVSRYGLFTAGTSYTLAPARGALFADFLVEGIGWSMMHNYFDPSVIGREVTKPWTSGWNGVAALLQAASAGGPRAGEIAEIAAAILETWPGGLSPELAAIASSLDAPSRWPSGFRAYPESDFVIFRRPGWYASIRMVSTRTVSGERTNGEGILGSRQSDGRLHLAMGGDEYWGEVWPALDWSRLPGITVERLESAASDYYDRGRRSFVGAAGDVVGGVAAMKLAPADSTLEAQKAWVFFDDAIVFLASDVRAWAGAPVETIVDQRPVLTSGPLTIDGRAVEALDAQPVRWTAGESVGWFFPRPQNVRVEDRIRTGSWSDLGSAANGSTTKRIRTILIEHGSSPAGGSAEYIAVPGADASRMAAWAAADPIEIVRNDAQIGAARDRRTGALGIAFWTAGSLGDLTVNRPALVWRIAREGRMELSIAEPARTAASVELSIAGSWKVASAPVGATASASRGVTRLVVPVSGGRTASVVLEPAGRRRAVRR